MEELDMIRFLSEHKWAVFTFFGAMIVAGGAFKASIEQKKSEEKATTLAVELREKTEDLQSKLDSETAEVKRYQSLTIELQGRAIDELKHQTSMLTGGNSHPLLLITPEHEKPYLYKPMLWVSGRYPLFNFSMSIQYRNGPKQGKKHEFTLDEVRQISPMYFGDLLFDLREFENLELYIRFFARNGGWDEVIKFRKTEDGKYQREIKLVSHHGQKEPIVYTSFEDENISFGNVSDIQSLEYHQ